MSPAEVFQLLSRNDPFQILNTSNVFYERSISIFSFLEAQVEHVSSTYTFSEDIGNAVVGVRLVNLDGPLQTNVDVR